MENPTDAGGYQNIVKQYVKSALFGALFIFCSYKVIYVYRMGKGYGLWSKRSILYSAGDT